MDLWNVRDLPAPPVNSAKYLLKSIDVDRLKKTFTEARDFFLSCNHLYTEAVLLSTFAYRMKLKFRTNKDFKQLEKINKALRVYFKMDICKILNDFYHLRFSCEEKMVYLPTKDMLDFVLVRIQGLAKLLVRIVETSKIAAEYMQMKLQIGHFWQQNLLVFCMVSRIYVITRHIVKFTCSMYDRILPFRNNLINVNINCSFLPENYNLPKDLRHWLDVDWIDEDIQYIEIDESEPVNIPFFNLADSDDEVEFCDEYIDIDNEKITFTSLFKRVKKTLTPSSLRGFNEDDIGDIINLENDEIVDNDILEVRSLSPENLTLDVPVTLNENIKKRLGSCPTLTTSSINVDDVDIGEEIPSSPEPSTSKTPDKNKGKIPKISKPTSEKQNKNKSKILPNTGEIVVIPDTPGKKKRKRNKKKLTNNQENIPKNLEKKESTLAETILNLTANIGEIIEIPDTLRKKAKNKKKLTNNQENIPIKPVKMNVESSLEEVLNLAANIGEIIDIPDTLTKKAKKRKRNKKKLTKNQESIPKNLEKKESTLAETILNLTANIGDIIEIPDTLRKKAKNKKKLTNNQENIPINPVKMDEEPSLEVFKPLNKNRKGKRKFSLDRIPKTIKRPRRTCAAEPMEIDNIPSTSTSNSNIRPEPDVKMDTDPEVSQRKLSKFQKKDLKDRLRLRRNKLKKQGLCKCYVIKRSILGSGRIQKCKYCKEHPIT